MRPIAYHSSQYSLGTLSGTHVTSTNLIERVADGSVNLGYEASRTGLGVGQIRLTMPTAIRPDALVIVRATGLEGRGFSLLSADADGGNLFSELNFNLGSTLPEVHAIGAGADRRMWLLASNGPDSSTYIHELQLAMKYELPRSPQVQVDRTRVRQFSRIPVAGGQPFVKRNGPSLRRTLHTFVLVSGTEVTEAEAFVDAVEGGQAFTFTDDRGETYWAELLGSDIAFQDSAGVFTVSLTFQEISAEL